MSKLKLDRIKQGMHYNMTILGSILLVFMLTTLLQAFFTWRSINNERLNRERMEVNVKNEKIDNLKEKVADVVSNSVAGFEHQLGDVQEIEHLLMNMVRQNPELLGSAVAFVPGYHKEQSRLYAPYCYRDDNSIRRKLLVYDYTRYEWYKKPIELGRPEWSEPYTDDDGTFMSMITYSVPLRDSTNRVVAVLTGDLPMSELGYITDIYHKNSMQSVIILVMQLVGMLLIVFIAWRAIVSMKKLRQVSRVSEQMVDEISLASQLQSAILPHAYPQHSRLAVSASLVNGPQVSGDFYDFSLQGDKFFFCIGDVATHGVGACLAMAVTRTACRASMQDNDSMSRMLAKMNQTLVEINTNMMYATFFACQLDLSTGLLRYCNAGHLSPYLLSGKDAAPLKVVPNVPLGIMEWEFEEQQLQLQPGDTLLLYTDGIIEAMNQQGTSFGEKRLALHLKKASENGDTPQALLKRIDTAISHHLGTDEKAEDDLTMLAVAYLESK